MVGKKEGKGEAVCSNEREGRNLEMAALWMEEYSAGTEREREKAGRSKRMH